jgi:predicted PurR-regulated permease PerM
MFNKDSNTISISTGTIIRFFLVSLGFFLIWVLRDLMLVVLTSIVITSFMESAVPFLNRIKVGRVFGVAILYILSLAILSFLFYLFAPLLITEIYNFSVFMSEYAPQVDFLKYFNNEAFSGAKDVVATLSDNLTFSSLLVTSKAFTNNLSSGFFSALSVAFGGIVNVGFIIVISFYLSIQEKGIENFLRIIIPLQYEDYVVDLWDRSSKKIASWVKGQMLLGVIVAVLTYLVLSLIGIQYALLLAIIAGMMELVPYGIWIALVPAAAFSYLSDGVSGALMTTGAYVIIHQFELFLFIPLILKKAVGLSPLVIILSLLIGFELGGAWGVVLSIPVAVVVMELLNDVEKRKIFTKVNNANNEK